MTDVFKNIRKSGKAYKASEQMSIRQNSLKVDLFRPES